MEKKTTNIKYSQSKDFHLTLTKDIIIDLVENCFYPIVFKGVDTEPHIDLSSDIQNLSISGLTFKDFKDEILRNTVITTFSLSIYNTTKDNIYSLVLLKQYANFDDVHIALISTDKIWVDDNIYLIEDKITNLDKKVEKLDLPPSGKSTNKWDKSNMLNLIGIITSIIIAIIGWTFFKS